MFFETTLTSLDGYLRDSGLAVSSDAPTTESNLRHEFRIRLRQLSALYDRIQLLNDHINATIPPRSPAGVELLKAGPPKPFAPYLPDSSELIMWLDCFYMLGFRAREVFNQKDPKVFPGCPEAVARGIRDVRNHLLVHPESLDTVQAWGLHLHTGPKIKPKDFRPTSAAPDDNGLYENARELRDDLEQALRLGRRRLASSTGAI